jgi:2-polyprenyl-3-methyl-5-hydroxy-6-metoxy-1,4-benzoquinol methylase
MNKIIEQQFTNIYNNNKNVDQETVSGIGSKITNAKELIDILPYIFKKYNISSIFDIGCGDFNWMKNIETSGISYTGGEIVLDVVKSNQKYENNNINFLHFDITSDDVPRSDLIICRGVLSFYNKKTILNIINKIIKSKSLYILLTNFRDETGNKIDFLQTPYNFPHPLFTIYEDINKNLSLWKISDLPIQVDQ